MTLYLPARQSDSVVDVSHWNGRPDWTRVQKFNPNLRAAIAKATQGRGRDPMWDWHATGIGPAGLLPGAYHFATNDDPQAQAENFVRTVQPVPGVLIAIDWEPLAGVIAPSHLLIEKLATIINTMVGRLPVMYLGRWQLPGPSAVLNRCDLWLPEYGTKPICPPGWSKWRLHQHTDGALGDATGPIAGIGFCDRSYYDETQGPIEEWWGR